jgi:hypothetical protein
MQVIDELQALGVPVVCLRARRAARTARWACISGALHFVRSRLPEADESDRSLTPHWP